MAFTPIDPADIVDSPVRGFRPVAPEDIVDAPVVETPAPQGWGDLAKNYGRSLGKGSVDLITGAGSILNTISNFASPVQRQITQQQLAGIGTATKDYIGEPEFKDPANRIIGKGIEYLPGALIPLGGTLPVRAAQAGFSGLGGGTAKELGLPEWVGAIGAPLAWAGLKSAAKTLWSPVETLAGKELLGNAGPEGRKAMEAYLSGGADDGMKTYAEIAESPSAAAYQLTQRNIPGAGSDAIEAALSARQSTRTEAIKELAPGSLEGIAPNVRGEAIQAAASDATEAAWKAASQKYKDLSLSGNIPLDSQKSEVAKVVTDIFGDSTLDMNKPVEKLVNKFLTHTEDIPVTKQGMLGEYQSVEKVPAASFNSLKKMKQDANFLFDEIKRANAKDRNLPVLSQLMKSLDGSVDDAVSKGLVSDVEAAAWKDARATYAATADVQKRTVAEAITRKAGGGSKFKLSAEATPAKITSNQQMAKEYMAAYKDSPELVAQGRAAAIDRVFKGKDYTRWGNDFDKQAPMLKEFFGDKFDDLKKVVDSIKAEAAVTERATRASSGRSFTTQGVTAAAKILASGPRALLRLFGTEFSRLGMAAHGNVPAVIASFGAQKLNNAITTAVQKAMVDPELLGKLAAKGTAANMDIAISGLAPLLASEISGLSKGAGADQVAEKLSQGKSEQDRSSSPKSITPTPTSKAKQFTSTDPVDIAVEEAIRMKDGEAPLPQADDFTKLLKAVSLQESGGNPDAVSDAGAIGLHQIMPATAKDIAKELGVTKYDLKDPETNTIFAAHYLKKLLSMFGNDPELALAAYHSGPGRVKNLLKLHDGKTLSAIRPYLGPVGKQYASGVLSKLKKIDKYGSVKT